MGEGEGECTVTNYSERKGWKRRPFYFHKVVNKVSEWKKGEVSESRIKEEGGGEIKGTWLDGKGGGN